MTGDAFRRRTDPAQRLAGPEYDPNDVAFPKERDPFGKALHEPGAKADEGKQIAGELVLSFPRAMEALIQVATFGAAKYSRGGFLSVESGELRYLDAAMRHLLKHGKGEDLDVEMGLPHLWAVLWNVAVMIELQERRNEKSTS